MRSFLAKANATNAHAIRILLPPMPAAWRHQYWIACCLVCTRQAESNDRTAVMAELQRLIPEFQPPDVDPDQLAQWMEEHSQTLEGRTHGAEAQAVAA